MSTQSSLLSATAMVSRCRGGHGTRKLESGVPSANVPQACHRDCGDFPDFVTPFPESTPFSCFPADFAPVGARCLACEMCDACLLTQAVPWQRRALPQLLCLWRGVLERVGCSSLAIHRRAQISKLSKHRQVTATALETVIKRHNLKQARKKVRPGGFV